MPLGLAEILTDGWVLLDEYGFGLKETAVTVALSWCKLKRVPKIGVIDTEQQKLVWRSDQGLLSLPRLDHSTKRSP